MNIEFRKSVADHHQFVQEKDEVYSEAIEEDVEIRNEKEDMKQEFVDDSHEKPGLISSIVAKLFHYGKV
ncbi:MAG: hypothetical protein AAF483_22275 [Planctomycetota bacterium]